MKSHQNTLARGYAREGVSPATCKRHAQSIFARAAACARVPAPRQASSFCPPVRMQLKNNKAPLAPKQKQDPSATTASTKSRQEEREKAKKRLELKALSEKQTKFIPLSKP